MYGLIIWQYLMGVFSKSSALDFPQKILIRRGGFDFGDMLIVQ